MEEASARGNWSNWLEFLFSIIGSMVGLGNVWRFPYVCYTNGGAAFLIPFLLAMLICGVPLFFLEISVCQYSNLGPGRLWVICPLFRGIGYGMVILSSVISLYYNVIIAWALYYMAMAFQDPLPWVSCDNWWNSPTCVPVGGQQGAGDWDSVANVTLLTSLKSVGNVINGTEVMSAPETVENMTVGLLKPESSVVQFWTNHVLQDSGRSISDVGGIRWQLMLCLLATWVVVFFCLFKDIKTSGKVVFVAAVLPYVVLLALLIRGCLLPGAVDGVEFYLVPRWHRLLDWQVWLAAASQVFYSTGVGVGGVSTLASFNRFHNNVYRDALLLPTLDAATSVFAGLVIFVYLGYMAHTQQTTVDKVVTQGTGLAFIAYPDALASMPLPQLWAVLFFLVLFTVGLDSQFVHVQTISSAVVDSFPRQLGHQKRWITLVVCSVGFVLGLPFVTQAYGFATITFGSFRHIPFVVLARMELSELCDAVLCKLELKRLCHVEDDVDDNDIDDTVMADCHTDDSAEDGFGNQKDNAYRRCGGQYVLMLCDWYIASVSVMLLTMGETLALSWIYGSNRLYEDITMMIGYRPNPVWHVFWKVISPSFVLVMVTMGMAGWKPLAAFPQWTVGFGWVIAVVPLVPIPTFALLQLFFSTGTLRERLLSSIRPTPLWKPALHQHEDQDEMHSFKRVDCVLDRTELKGDHLNAADATNEERFLEM